MFQKYFTFLFFVFLFFASNLFMGETLSANRGEGFSLKYYRDLNVKVPGHIYGGAALCKVCHQKKEQGEQFQSWEKTAHANAYKRLATDEAKKIGRKYGVKNPQKDKRCLQCHVTAVRAKRKYRGFLYKRSDGVSCEACHGPGQDFAVEEIMKNKKLAVQKGLINPPKPELCTRCHNKDRQPPETYKGPYDFKKMFQKIKHYRPGKTPTEDWK